MKIVVTGGAGFIVSHLVDALLKVGHQVLVVDDLSVGKKQNVNKKAEFVKLDIRDDKLYKFLNKFKPDIIYHLAAQKNVRISLNKPKQDAEINILGSLNLLEYALQKNLKKFIFVSTAGIYGEAEQIPTSESSKEQALSPYILSKLVFEKYLKILSRNKLKWSALRLANVYGSRQDPYGEAGVVAVFLNNIINNKTLFVNGDGKQTRDFVYIDDIIDALIKSLDKEGIYNIGTGIKTSLLDLIGIMNNISGREIKITHRDAISGEVRHNCLDSSKAQGDLNWQAKTSLLDGLKSTYQWFEKNK